MLFRSGPTKSIAPSEIPCRSFDSQRKPKRIDVGLMVGSDDQATARRHVLHTGEFNFPEQATEEGNNRPDDFKRPLWKYRAAVLRSRLHSLCGICAVSTQVRDILQRPFLIYELDVNSRNAVCSCATRSNGRVRGNALLLVRQANKTPLRNL